MSGDADALLADLGLKPATDFKFVVHVLDEESGHVGTYTQQAPTMYVAITMSEREHRKLMGRRGKTIFAQDMSIG